MSEHKDEVVARFEGVGKMYKTFDSRTANLVDALGLGRYVRSHESRFREFWALRGIDFELRRGQRLGVIGRNGAGKSTLLKLLTGNLPPTEGVVMVGGAVQALLEMGGGLHPEFTGYENIRAALVQLGLNSKQIEAATDDIAEFTELGRFLGQPMKTYSSGMQARLAFAVATTVQPEILIVDEVLGAGDAYFFGKSLARMRGLIENGAAVILVSHALEQVVRFCDETMWIDRGRVTMRGPSQEVVKAYEKFIRNLEDKRLQAKNRKGRQAHFDAFERESYTDNIVILVRAGEAAGSAVDVSDVRLLRDGEVDDSVAVGLAQDASPAQSAAVVLDGSHWSPPYEEDTSFYRSIVSDGDPRSSGWGNAVFYLWFLYPDSTYELEIRYRTRGEAGTIAYGRGGKLEHSEVLPPAEDWQLQRLPLSRQEATDPEDTRTTEAAPETSVSRWSGSSELALDEIQLLDDDGQEQAIFLVGRPLIVSFEILATADGVYQIIPAALVFRMDGIVVTRHVSEPAEVELKAGQRLPVRLDFGPLLLGDGQYLLSLGLYKKLDPNDIDPSEFYDYFDKSFEFQVVGNPRLHNELVRHPGEWTLGAASALPAGAEAEAARHS